jgi:hypothetical protein
MDFNNFLETYQAAQAEFRSVYLSSSDKKLFFHKHGIMYKTNETKLDKVKYEISCKFQQPFTFACRGTTIVNEKKFAFALNKFFNRHEVCNRMQQDMNITLQQLESDGFRLLYMPKWDGSNIHVFYDNDSNLHIYTLGSINTTIILNDSSTWSEVASRLLFASFPDLMEYLKDHPMIAVVCELITKWNKIITEYEFDFIVPLVMIDETGLPYWDDLSILAPGYFKDNVPQNAWIFESKNSDSVYESAIQNMLSNPNQFGKDPEGVCGYAYKLPGDYHKSKILNRGFCLPFEKRKRSEYLQLHCNLGTRIGNPKDLCNMQILFLENKSDDIQEPERVSHINEFKFVLQTLCDTHEFFPSAELSQKEFAEFVRKHIPKSLQKPVYIVRKSNQVLPNDKLEFLSMLLLTPIRGATKCIELLQSEHGPEWFKTQLLE